MWERIKANPWRYIIMAMAAVVVIIVAFLLIGSAINSYKESQFLKRQAEYQKQIDEAKQRADIAQGEATRAKEEAKAKDAQIAGLQSEMESLRAEVGQKRIVYVNSRKPVTLRPVGAGVSDAELRADAKRLGIVIR